MHCYEHWKKITICRGSVHLNIPNLADKFYVMQVKVNVPHVVHETIEGETILLDLRTGMYYSLDENGSALWDFLAATGSSEKAVETLSGGTEDLNPLVREGVEGFVSKLLNEGLLIRGDLAASYADAASAVDSTGHIHGLKEGQVENLRTRAGSFQAPVMQKYADMQDLLLLDPIHDVDQEGWPEPKKDE
jgi:hypothetical protein